VNAVKKRFRNSLRLVLLVLAAVTAVVMIRNWRAQVQAPLSCRAAFGTLEEHNGYLQLNVLGPNPREPYFEGQIFIYYPASQSPPTSLRITRETSGSYARTFLSTDLIPFSRGLATAKPVPFDIPSPDVSQRLFPFDSPSFDIWLRLEPPVRPKVLFVRNFAADFIPLCNTLESQWKDSGDLRVAVKFQRNPFVQTTAVVVSVAALVFGVLLGGIRNRETLAVATASYFFSIWSVRAVVAPPALAFPTILDFWLMAVAVVVLFVVAWRVIGSIGVDNPGGGA